MFEHNVRHAGKCPEMTLNGGQKAVNTAKQKVENRVAKKAGEAADKALDNLEGKGNQKTETEETVEGTKKNGTSDNQKSEKLTATSNYDFVAGDKVILYEDFSQDAVGDFPALWTTNKSGEINTLSIAPGNWLNLNATEGNWWLLKQIEFPKNFIVELDVVPKKGACCSQSPNPTIDSKKSIAPGKQTNNGSAIISGLKPETSYYVRAYAKSGSNVFYGNELSFTTTANEEKSSTNSNFGQKKETKTGEGKLERLPRLNICLKRLTAINF